MGTLGSRLAEAFGIVRKAQECWNDSRSVRLVRVKYFREELKGKVSALPEIQCGWYRGL